MAIKLPDPGNGIAEDKTGYNEWENMKIVRENFADQSNAASRSVGTATGQVPLVEQIESIALKNTTKDGKTNLLLKSGDSIPENSAASRLVGTATGQIPLAEDAFKAAYGSAFASIAGSANADDLPDGSRTLVRSSTVINAPSETISNYWVIDTIQGHSTAGVATIQLAHSHAFEGRTSLAKRVRGRDGWSEWSYFYGTHNTTKDTATGFLKASSPVLHVYNDSITKIHEAEQLDITVDKKDVGHYEIHGTTGLRKNDGWNMTPPRDLHGNVLCMIDVTEKDDVVILKTYKRKFDLELAAIVHDYDNPMDIPDGVCVEFRFNDLPQEQLDEPTI